MNTTKIENHKLANLLLCTFRYSLGRATYITSDCKDWLTEYWHLIPLGWKQQIHNDIKSAIERNHAGDKCDIDSWRKVLELPIEEAKESSKLVIGRVCGGGL